MARPCFCKLHGGLAEFPGSSAAAPRTGTRPGGPAAPPSFYDAKVNSAIKAVMGKLEVPRASRYAPHGFRRGAANEIETKGPQWPTAATAGEWRYVDMAPDLGRELYELIIETDCVDSDLCGDLRSLGEGDLLGESALARPPPHLSGGH